MPNSVIHNITRRKTSFTLLPMGYDLLSFRVLEKLAWVCVCMISFYTLVWFWKTSGRAFSSRIIFTEREILKLKIKKKSSGYA